MTGSGNDGGAEFYARRLWALLPEIYRELDSDAGQPGGPLWEIVNRIGVSMADVRRGIDRLWANQSIEEGDDWSIALIAELVGARMIPELGPRGARADVASTIRHRRQRGTLSTIQEVARDVTGWETLAKEERRLIARTRHTLDGPQPAVGYARLTEPWRGTAAGGPFDQLPHAVDLRHPRAAAGSPRLDAVSVWLWRLHSLQVTDSDSVRAKRPTHDAAFADIHDPRTREFVDTEFDDLPHITDLRHSVQSGPWEWRTATLNPQAAPIQYAFDPTGRDVQLFFPPPAGAHSRTPQRAPWQVPGPATPALLAAVEARKVMQTACWLDSKPGQLPDELDPERGRFASASATTSVTYTYGAAAFLGAGPYARPQPDVMQYRQPPVIADRGLGLHAALLAVGGDGLVSITDSATYQLTAERTKVNHLGLAADSWQRPVIDLSERWAGHGVWYLEGGGPAAQLALSGLYITGGDLVLEGTFQSVVITYCTVDPGTMGESEVACGIDGRRLRPCRVKVAASAVIQELVIQHSVLGPISGSTLGHVEHCNVAGSIVQSIEHGRALSLPDTRAVIATTTILGNADAGRMRATDTLFHGEVNLGVPTTSAVSYSAVPPELEAQFPRGQHLIPISPRAAVFRSTRFGCAGYGQLRGEEALGPDLCGLTTGAANRAEVGAMNSEQASIRTSAVRTKLAEYLPIGLWGPVRAAT